MISKYTLKVKVDEIEEEHILESDDLDAFLNAITIINKPANGVETSGINQNVVETSH